MNESDKTRKFLLKLKQRPEFVVHKFSDRFAVGWPDAVVIGKGRSVWLEFKNLRTRADLDPHTVLTPHQERKLRQLWVASEGRAFVIGFTETAQGPRFNVTRANGTSLGKRMEESEVIAMLLACLSQENVYDLRR